MHALEIKVVLVGESAVGKTSIVNRYVGRKTAGVPEATLGAQYATAHLVVHGQKVILQIWDTAGQERFRVLTPMYYRRAHAVIIVYSVVDERSFNETSYWMTTVRSHINENCAIFLVGNKSDLPGREVLLNTGADRAEKMNAQFFETSAVTGASITELFNDVAMAALCIAQDARSAESIEIPKSTETEKKECC
jgi:small GTP-binding protein